MSVSHMSMLLVYHAMLCRVRSCGSMSWVRDNFRSEAEVLVAPPSTATPPKVSNVKLIENLEWKDPRSEGVTLGTDIFSVSNDEAMLRTFSKDVVLSASLDLLTKGKFKEVKRERVKVQQSIKVLKTTMSEKRIFLVDLVA